MSDAKLISYLTAGARLTGCKVSMVFDHSGRTVTLPDGSEYISRGLGLDARLVKRGLGIGQYLTTGGKTLGDLLRENQPGYSGALPGLIAQARTAIADLNATAEGDSNDAEIEAGQEVRDVLESIIDTLTKGA